MFKHSQCESMLDRSLFLWHQHRPQKLMNHVPRERRRLGLGGPIALGIGKVVVELRGRLHRVSPFELPSRPYATASLSKRRELGSPSEPIERSVGQQEMHYVQTRTYRYRT
jgi:hypothetical protein